MANKGRPKLEKTKDKVLSIRISDEINLGRIIR